MQAKASKTAYFDPLAIRQGTAHLFDHGFDGKLNIALRQMLIVLG